MNMHKTSSEPGGRLYIIKVAKGLTCQRVMGGYIMLYSYGWGPFNLDSFGHVLAGGF